MKYDSNKFMWIKWIVIIKIINKNPNSVFMTEDFLFLMWNKVFAIEEEDNKIEKLCYNCVWCYS